MAKTNYIELPDVEPISILYEDRSVLAIDKPAGWLLVPVSWQKTSRNLQAALMSSINGGDFWAHSRNLKFIRYVHRLDGETSGVILFAKSPGALSVFEKMFETRAVEKVYLAVSAFKPKQTDWSCKLSIGNHPREAGRMIVSPHGRTAVTDFHLVASVNGKYLIEARPHTGRTHQIRIHLAETGCPIIGDDLYGRGDNAMALRAVGLAYINPFTRKPVAVRASVDGFLRDYGFAPDAYQVSFATLPPRRAPDSKA